MMMKNLILASGSPRRKELLSLYTTDFTICISDFDENGVTAPTPAQLVEKLARGKCLAVAKDHPGAVVLLHSTSRTNAEILDELLTKWEEEGYRFATVEELFAS